MVVLANKVNYYKWGGIDVAFAWRPDLSVGFDEIDDQHKELFARVNTLLEATSQGKGKEAVGRTISYLGQYVASHFGTEERHMARSQYPEVSSHKAQHVQFTNEFSTIKKKFEAEGPTSQLTILIQRQVCDWLINHIGKTDKALGAFLRAKA